MEPNPGPSWVQIKPFFLAILGEQGANHHTTRIKNFEDKLNEKYHKIREVFFLLMTNLIYDFAPDEKSIQDFIQTDKFSTIFGVASLNIRKFMEDAIVNKANGNMHYLSPTTSTIPLTLITPQ